MTPIEQRALHPTMRGGATCGQRRSPGLRWHGVLCGGEGTNIYDGGADSSGRETLVDLQSPDAWAIIGR